MENDTKKMAELLRLGHKMLNIACPECNNPIFQDRSNNMFCSVCNRRVLFENEIEDKTTEEVYDIKTENSIDKSKVLEKLKYETKSVLIEKYYSVLEKLKNEFQIQNIPQYLNILEEILRFLEVVTL